jgi:hypothetical protein
MNHYRNLLSTGQKNLPSGQLPPMVKRWPIDILSQKNKTKQNKTNKQINQLSSRNKQLTLKTAREELYRPPFLEEWNLWNVLRSKKRKTNQKDGTMETGGSLETPLDFDRPWPKIFQGTVDGRGEAHREANNRGPLVRRWTSIYLKTAKRMIRLACPPRSKKQTTQGSQIYAAAAWGEEACDSFSHTSSKKHSLATCVEN